ncbi:MAG: class I SAM-dependent methyltransferase family protein [Candidatus Micrarchaeota archaeon]
MPDENTPDEIPAKTPALAVPKKSAQEAHRLLIRHGALDHLFKIKREGGRVLFPILPSLEKKVKALKLGETGRVVFEKSARRPLSLQELLAPYLSEQEMARLIGSFDIVGDIAVLEIPDALAHQQERIAAAMLELYKHVKVVAKKTDGTGGPYRIRPVEVIAGEQRTRTVCKESGCEFEVDLNEVYFTPRFSSERLRIAGQVKSGENVLVLFAGVAPYAIVIEKKASPKSKPAKIICVELNPRAVELARRNVERNKCRRIEVIEGDVKEVLAKPRFLGWADRVLMPHPSDSLSFLPQALRSTKDGGILHLYAFTPIEAGEADVLERAKQIAKKEGYALELLSWREVRPYSPVLSQVVLDLEVKRI